MIARTFDADAVNALVNRPDVRPDLGFPELGELDVSALLADERNVCLSNGAGLIWFAYHAPGVFEAHIVCEPDYRGQPAMSMARAMLAMMFVEHGAVLIWCRPPVERRDVIMFAKTVGFMLNGEAEGSAILSLTREI